MLANLAEIDDQRELEPSNLQRCQIQFNEAAVHGTDTGEVNRHEVAAEVLAALDAFVIVQEIAAAIQDQPILIDLDRLGVVR